MLITLGWSKRSVGEQVPTPRGELRIVDKDPLNWAYITWNVFEHLVEIDKDGKLVPRLAAAWQWLDDRTLEMTLRQGVKFHNGEVFDAEIVKLNWEENTRLQQPRMPGAYLKPHSTLCGEQSRGICAAYQCYPQPHGDLGDGAALVG